MDEQILDSIAHFGPLWQRVTGQTPETSGPAQAERTYPMQDALLLFIHDEICAAAGAAALAKGSPPDGRTVLSRHAADARRHLRRLRAEYFILTGLMAGGNDDCRPAAGKLASLREAYLQAGSLAARYAQAAEQADQPELAEVFAGFAADERRRGQELRALLVGSF